MTSLHVPSLKTAELTLPGNLVCVTFQLQFSCLLSLKINPLKGSFVKPTIFFEKYSHIHILSTAYIQVIISCKNPKYDCKIKGRTHPVKTEFQTHKKYFFLSSHPKYFVGHNDTQNLLFIWDSTLTGPAVCQVVKCLATLPGSHERDMDVCSAAAIH